MDKEAMRLMRKYGTYYVPTITAGKWVAEHADSYPAVVQPKARAVGPQIQDTFATAYKNKVKIAFGTDAGVFPHGMNAREFFYMVEAGMPAIEAIQSATIESAKLLRIDDKLGSIKEGKIADIVAVKGDPLKDIRLMEQVSFVMKEGKVYKQ
jgi:imidazolonepropionase-like amidohydrolase